MKNGKILRLLSVAILLPLLLVTMIITPVLAAPIITLSPETGAAGTMVTVKGENFDSYVGDNMYVFFGSQEITTSPLTVPETGVFNYSFNIPAEAKPGGHTIRVKNEFTTLALSTFTIPETEISLDKTSGNTGIKVVIDGKGFAADKVVAFYYDNGVRKILGTQPAGPAGDFSFSFTVPESVGGVHLISAENTVGSYAEAEFEVIPLITLRATSGAVGEILTVSGTGFGQRSDVSVYFKGEESAYAKADENGIFGVAFFNVPSMPPGSYDVTAEDDEANTAKATFTIVAGASLDEAAGSVGSELSVSGTGFIPGGEITVRYGEAVATTAPIDVNGGFEVTLKVPVSRAGEHIVTVSDGATSRELVFTMEDRAPLVPGLRLPPNASRTRGEAYLDWANVSDASSPVTYRLQIASDIGFTALVLDKKGLTRSGYTLAGAEKLAAVRPEAPYYWRVKAVDSATNESAWSLPWSFNVPAPLAPALLLPETGVKAEKDVFFDWENVTSFVPPVTYHIQVATDRDFTSVILERTGLAKSEYTSAEDEALPAVKKEFPYYWRVRAIDSDDNAGDWSTPGSFYVSFSLPGWLIYLLIGMAALLVGFIAFLLGRRVAYFQTE